MAYTGTEWDDKVIEASKLETASKAASSLGIKYTTYRKHAKRLGVFSTNQSGKGTSKQRELPLDIKEILQGHRPETQTGVLKRYLLRLGIKANQCERCNASSWMNEPLICHLDHINGINNDHRLENLRMLCPNCHSQTTTYAGKNSKGKMVPLAGFEPALIGA